MQLTGGIALTPPFTNGDFLPAHIGPSQKGAHIIRGVPKQRVSAKSNQRP